MSEYGEQRRYTRVKIDLFVAWGWTEECKFTDKITSLSEGGCFIRTERLAVRGQPLYAALWLPTETVLRGEARYNLEGIGIGVAFLDVPNAERETLRLLVEDFGRSASQPGATA